MLNDLYPLLRTVQPAELNYTLNAIATALEGRGTARREPRDARRLPEAAQPRASPPSSTTSGCSARSPTPTPTCCPSSPRLLRNTVTTTHTLEDQRGAAQGAVQRRAELLRHAPSLPRANGDNLVRLADLSAAQPRAARALRARVPLPARRHRRAAPAPGRGVPRHHPAHRARDPAATSRAATARRTPGLRRQAAATYCGTLPDPPWSQSNPLTSQPDFNDGVDEPTGKGTSRVGPAGPAPPPATPARRRRVGAAQLAARPGPRRAAPTEVPDLGRCCVGPLARGTEVSCDEPILDKQTATTWSSCSSSSSSPRSRPALLVVTIGNLDFGSTQEYKAVFTDATGVVKGDDIRVAGVKVGSVKERRDRRPHPCAGHLQRRPRHARSTAAPTPTSATATSSASATSR